MRRLIAIGLRLGLTVPALPGSFSTVFRFGSCATWSKENRHPPSCDWMDRPARPE